MESQSRLIAYAYLHTCINDDKDIYSIIEPLISLVLSDIMVDITSSNISTAIEAEYSLEIPPEVIQTILNRFVRKGYLKKDQFRYTFTEKKLPSVGGMRKNQEDFKRNINQLVNSFIHFANKEFDKVLDQPEALSILQEFVSKFSITFLSDAYKIDTKVDKKKELSLAGQYVIYLQQNDTVTFDCLVKLVSGSMVANALYYTDIPQQSLRAYKNLNIYLDTPLIVSLLGLSGEMKEKSTQKLVELIHLQKGTIKCFSHVLEETINLLKTSADEFNSPTAYGNVIIEAKRKGLSKADLYLLAHGIEEALSKFHITPVPSPLYETKYQIDEKYLEEKLSFYRNQHAKRVDVDSIRCIYALRNGLQPRNICKSRELLATNNSALIQVVHDYEQEKMGRGSSISAIISSFELINYTWLISSHDISLPKIELLALAFSLTELNDSFIAKVIKTSVSLKEQGAISEEQEIMLRTLNVQKELSDCSLGDENELSPEAVEAYIKKYEDNLKDEAYSETRIIKAKLEEKERDEQNAKDKEQSEIQVIKNKAANCANLTTKIVMFALILTGIAVTIFKSIYLRNSITADILFDVFGYLIFTVCGFAIMSLFNPIKKILERLFFILFRILNELPRIIG